MYENKCAICGQPIIGYWYPVGKNNICQSCGASMTVYDLYMHDIVDIKPDIVESDATLVTKDVDAVYDALHSGDVEKYVDSKNVLNTAYGMTVNAMRDELHDDGYHYTNEDVAAALKIINDIKMRGIGNVTEFYDECEKLWREGAHPRPEDSTYSDNDNPLLILRKKYDSIMPEPRFEGDVGNETWKVMFQLWD